MERMSYTVIYEVYVHVGASRYLCSRVLCTWQTNVLVDEDYRILLTDFGLSDFVKTRTASYGMVRLENIVALWAAPERYDIDRSPDLISRDEEYSGTPVAGRSVSSTGRASFASDIYSFGCLCVEVRSSCICIAYTDYTLLQGVLQRCATVQRHPNLLPPLRSRGGESCKKWPAS